MAKDALDDAGMVNVRLTAISGGVKVRELKLKWSECFACSLNRGDHIHVSDGSVDAKDFCISISEKIVYSERGHAGPRHIHFLGVPVREPPVDSILSGDR